MTSSIFEIEAFLGKYRTLTNKQSGQDADRFKSEFERIKLYFGQVRAKTEKLAREEAHEFNILRLLGLEANELHHSTLLAHLLDPEGTHGQANIILKTFLSRIADDQPHFIEICQNCDRGKWIVEAEKSTTSGRMDIAIWNRQLGVFIVIENKIYAYEQPQQLKRYGDWLVQHQRDFPTYALIYLTLRGDISQTAYGIQYISMSYKEDIADWLHLTMDSNPALPARVKGTLLQYLDTIERL